MEINSKVYWDARFDKDWEHKGGLQQTQRLAEIVIKNIYFLPTSPISILDVGCATGEMVNLLTIHFPFAKVYGCDSSKEIIKKCQQKFPYLRSNFFVADIFDLSKETKKRFDLVVCSNILEHLHEPEKVLEELIKVSKRYVLILVRAEQEPSEKQVFCFKESFFTQKGFSVHKDFTTNVSMDGVQFVAILDKKFPLKPLSANPKVLIASPVRQEPEILREFLVSLSALDITGLQVDFLFIDNNENQTSSTLLLDFKNKHPSTIIWQIAVLNPYKRGENYHSWKETTIWRVAAFKNKIISYAFKKGYDYLFLVDSDLILHPYTLKRLIRRKKDIISNIFWTKWYPDTSPLPQIWFMDDYTLYKRLRRESITSQDKQNRLKEAIYLLLLQPGTYEVGGLGACTLLSQKAMKKKVNFSPLYNISLIGEDRHFCIRSVSLGFQLFVDTYYPAFHIYRKDDLLKVSYFKQLCEESIKNNMPLNGVKLFQLVESSTVNLLFQEGTSLLQQGQTERALERFKEVLKLNMSHALTHNTLAFIYWQKKDIEKALYHITKAVELAPDNRDIIWNCGQIMIGLGKVEDAYEVYKRYLEKHPEEEEIRQVIEEVEKIKKSCAK